MESGGPWTCAGAGGCGQAGAAGAAGQADSTVTEAQAEEAGEADPTVTAEAAAPPKRTTTSALPRGSFAGPGAGAAGGSAVALCPTSAEGWEMNEWIGTVMRMKRSNEEQPGGAVRGLTRLRCALWLSAASLRSSEPLRRRVASIMSQWACTAYRKDGGAWTTCACGGVWMFGCDAARNNERTARKGTDKSDTKTNGPKTAQTSLMPTLNTANT